MPPVTPVGRAVLLPVRLGQAARLPVLRVLLAFLLVVAYFLYLAAGGLHAYFTSDDAINLVHLHGYFITPIHKLFLDIVNPLTSSYRPLGGLFYRTMYAIAGYNPVPFRYVCLLLLLVNMALAFRLLRLLASSTEAALLGLLLIAYHPALSELYYSTGTIYDILCYMFLVIALSSYIERRQNRRFSASFLIALLFLNLLALQSKEIGCMLPAAIFLYEACYRGLSRRSVRELMPIILTGLFTSALLLHRLLTPNEMSRNPLYQPRLSADFYLQTCARYHSMLFFSYDLFSIPAMLCVWGAMALLAAVLRSKPMAFGLSFWMVALVPIAVIPGRAGFVLYIPMLGLGLYFGALAVRLREVIVRAPRFRFVSQMAVFGLTMAGLAEANIINRPEAIAGLLQADRNSRGVMTQLHGLHRSLKPGAHILFVDDPFPPDSWYLTFATELMYHDPWISVDRVKRRPHSRTYSYVFTYSGDRLTELALPPCPIDSKPVADAMDDASLRICWQGPWTAGEFPNAYESTLTFTNQKGATATFNFEGSSLTYVYTKAYNRGIAELWIDGVSRATIDQYAPGILWRQNTVVGGLQQGNHTAEIRVLHRRSPAAKDSYVDVDAFIPGPAKTSP